MGERGRERKGEERGREREMGRERWGKLNHREKSLKYVCVCDRESEKV